MKNLLMVIFATLVTGCASNQMALQSATANHFKNVVASDVSVSDIDRGVLNVTWNATVNGVDYLCEADDMVKNSNCKEK